MERLERAHWSSTNLFPQPVQVDDMKYLLAFILLFSVAAYAGEEEADNHDEYVKIICAITAPANWLDGHTDTAEKQECTPDGKGVIRSDFPYDIPANKSLCVTDYLMANKFPYDPPEYGKRMRTLYALFLEWSVPAHHPQYSLVTPQRYPGGIKFRAWVLNGMSEPQNTYIEVLGFLTTGSCLRR